MNAKQTVTKFFKLLREANQLDQTYLLQEEKDDSIKEKVIEKLNEAYELTQLTWQKTVSGDPIARLANIILQTGLGKIKIEELETISESAMVFKIKTDKASFQVKVISEISFYKSSVVKGSKWGVNPNSVRQV